MYFEAALVMPAEARHHFMDDLASKEPELCHEVLALVDAD